MANNYFQFKEFKILQDGAAMKVGTDGVLLGAWAEIREAKNILDIGTGSGLIALMLAQRSNIKTQIDAVEIDEDAFVQAKENINASPWKQKISIYNSSFQSFSLNVKHKYELIVSNPPYFTDAFKATGDARNTARHTDSLSFNDLLIGVKEVISPNGRLAIVLPVTEGEVFINQAIDKYFFMNKKIFIKPTPTKLAKRLLLEFSMGNSALETNELIVELSRHNYSDEYKRLCKDFYLKF